MEESVVQEKETVHEHSFSTANCVEAAICACGAINGEATGHSWQNATCLVPMNYAVCGATEGSVGAHSYSDGSCYVCGAEDPDYVVGVTVWLPKSGKRFHYVSDCSGMKSPRQATEAEAIRQGYTACPNCVY